MAQRIVLGKRPPGSAPNIAQASTARALGKSQLAVLGTLLALCRSASGTTGCGVGCSTGTDHLVPATVLRTGSPGEIFYSPMNSIASMTASFSIRFSTVGP
ncbi:MAG: hypothetical protein DMG40_13380 [Acidobacteria bacterium]|nr:MAG: hypothetical protein DMG40_13380 [Acidobacteriota bacterium]